jgi:hypothetical protein
MEYKDCTVVIVLRGFGLNIIGDLRQNVIRQVAKDLQDNPTAYIEDIKNVGVLVMPNKVIV